MTWQPTEAQTMARLDPDANPREEAEARVRAARTLLDYWLTTRDPMLLAAADDMLQIAMWWSQE